MEKRCKPLDGLTIRFGAAGDMEVDPCLYEEVETIEHCTVHILRCSRCGHVEVEWEQEKSGQRRIGEEAEADGK